MFPAISFAKVVVSNEGHPESAHPMTEISNSTSVPKAESRRCLACRLPDDLRDEIARDRIREWATFAALAGELAGRGFQLSESAIRRPFRHGERGRYFERAEGETDAAHLATTPPPL